MSRKEVKDFKLHAYRTITEGDKKFQNWRSASTVHLELVVEIDGIEIPVASESVPFAVWERSVKDYEATE